MYIMTFITTLIMTFIVTAFIITLITTFKAKVKDAHHGAPLWRWCGSSRSGGAERGGALGSLRWCGMRCSFKRDFGCSLEGDFGCSLL